MFKEYIALLRVYQYVKNLFIFAPLFFSFDWSIDKFLVVLIGFCLFSLSASGIYIINDIKDADIDKFHPTKKYRPIPSGKISKQKALSLSAMLIFLSILCSIFVTLKFSVILVTYIILNMMYSFKLKYVPILDIIVIASNYVIRIIAGIVLAKVEVSMWILLVTFALALFLAVAKRREEVLLYMNGVQTRKVIESYNLDFINSAMSILGSVTIVCYIMYTLSSHAKEIFKTDKIMLTSIFVIAGIMRYLQITFVNNKSGDPSKVVLKDRFLQITILMWILSFVIIKFCFVK